MLAVAATLLTASCAGRPMAPLADFEGSWAGTHRIAGDEAVYPATYEVRAEADALIWEFRSEWGGGFTGRGVQSWDPDRGEFVEIWTDSMQGPPLTMRGQWDAATATLLMHAEGEDWESGAKIPYQHRTVQSGSDAWSYTMIAEKADGPVEVMWIEMKRQ